MTLTQGFKVPTKITGANWTGPSNVQVDDGNRASYNAATQDDLRMTGFGFRMPPNATIQGVEVHHQGQGASATAAQRQVRVGLTKNGTALAGTRKTGLEYAQGADTDLTSGGSADLWGSTWTPAEINAETFGVLLSDNDTTAAQLDLDYVEVKVHYTLPVFPADPKPFFPYTEGKTFVTLISEMENRAEQRRRKGSARARFDLRYDPLTKTEIDTLWNFYVARKGAFEPFTFTDLNDSVEYVVRFEEDHMSRERFSGALFKTGLKLIETNG